jgi:formate/nitrite transporter FocA (FNT family)
MYFFPLAALLGGPVSWGDFARNVGPVIAGNIVGGSVLVALVYYVIYIRPLRAETHPAASQGDVTADHPPH